MKKDLKTKLSNNKLILCGKCIGPDGEHFTLAENKNNWDFHYTHYTHKKNKHILLFKIETSQSYPKPNPLKAVRRCSEEEKKVLEQSAGKKIYEVYELQPNIQTDEPVQKFLNKAPVELVVERSPNENEIEGITPISRNPK